MSAEITALRKSGELNDAYELAKVRLAEDPENIWIVRAMSWVLYDMLKLAIAREDHNEVENLYKQVNALILGSEERVYWDTLAMQAVAYVWGLAKRGEGSKLLSLLVALPGFTFLAPSEYYSSVVQAIVRCSKECLEGDSVIISLLEWISPDSFRYEDYDALPVEGKQYALRPLVEMYYSSYAKCLLRLKDVGRIQAFLPRLEAVVADHPNYVWCWYNVAKLMFLAGNAEMDTIREKLLPVIRSQRSQFWAWELYADTYPKYSQERFAFLSKAMLCPMHSPEMTVGLRKEMVRELHHRHYYAEARFEIEQIIRLRKEQGWREAPEITACLSMAWYVDAALNQEPKSIYLQNVQYAESLIFGEQQKTQLLITYINEDKGIASTLSESRENGFFSYKRLPKSNLKVGYIYEVTLTEEPNKLEDAWRYKVSNVKEIKELRIPDLIKSTLGTVRLTKRGVIFVGDILVPSLLAELHNLCDGISVSVIAYVKWNKRKGEFGWVARELSVMP